MTYLLILLYIYNWRPSLFKDSFDVLLYTFVLYNTKKKIFKLLILKKMCYQD